MDRDEALRLLGGGKEGVREWNRRRAAGEDIPDFAGADLHGVILSEADLSRAKLRGADLRGTSLRGAVLGRAVLSKAKLSEADLGGADLRGANLIEADLSRVNLGGADLSGAYLTSADLRGADLGGADLGGTYLIRADLRGANFGRANLIEANLRGTCLKAMIIDDQTKLEPKWRLVWEVVNQAVPGRYLREVDLSRADLRGGDLREADLREADLSEADLGRADLSGANLRGTCLKATIIDDQTKLEPKWRLVWEVVNQAVPGRHLRGADLRGANLRRADLREADLRGADLREADLGGANLRRADLRGADLSGASLSEADLSGADLREADLREADLIETNLRGTCLKAMIIDDQTKLEPKWRLVWEVVNQAVPGRYLRGADLGGANLREADLRGADLRGANLREADLRGADLAGADLSWADRSGADLRGADLGGADLRGADLRGAVLGRADLGETDFSHRHLRGACLKAMIIDDQTKLEPKWRLVWEVVNQAVPGRHLSGADLSGANLLGADLLGADLAGADLRGASLGGANLRGANLSGADLRGADRSGADLAGADLRGADLGEVKISVTARLNEVLKGLPPQAKISRVMSAYYPKEVEPLVWHPLYAYIFGESAASQVDADAREQLGERVQKYRCLSQPARRPLAMGCAVTATPRLEGFQFNPPSQTVELHEDWHRLDFRLRARPERVGTASNGLLTFTVEGVIVADIPISIYVGDRVTATEMVNALGKPYRSIFCSYSRRDTCVVKRVERACKALGMDYLRDVVSLRSGEPWQPALLSMIERADIFQLFWSRNAVRSKYVEDEWRYALRLSREPSRFIRPVYWTEPMPSPPPELAHLSFAFVPELASLLWRFVSLTYRLVARLRPRPQPALRTAGRCGD